MTYRIVTACRLCDSADLTEALNLGETPLANELDGTELFPLVVNRCGSCGHHQLSIAVNPERLWGPSYPYQSGTSPVFREHLSKLADEVAATKPGGRVLEIASNDGTLVKMLAVRGLFATGVDPSGESRPLTEVGGGEWATLRGSWPIGFGPKPQPCDVILALNVFAHVDDLHSFTAAVKEALAPDGVFVVEVGSAARMVDSGVFDTCYHEHCSYHDIGSLYGFFLRHGLRITGSAYNDSQGGTLRVYVGHDRGGTGSFWDGPWFDGLGEALGAVIDNRGAALREAFAKLQKRGEKVAIYGAPAKLTTLLYATGLQDYPFVCVGDDNPRKVGRTTPGNHIPIVSVEEMLAKKPDTIVVAAWNFYADIYAKLRSAGYKGGVINPMGTT